MDCQILNKHGVFLDPKKIEIKLPKNLKSRVEIRIAKEKNEQFFYGYDCQVRDSGASCAPSISGKSYESFSTAVCAAGEFLKKYLSNSSSDERKIKKIVSAIDATLANYAQSADLTGHTINRQRPRGKAYLVCKGKYFIWKGHYNFDPDRKTGGVTDVVADAYRFDSLQACIEGCRSSWNYPEEHEHCIWNGYFVFFEETRKGLRRVMPCPEQGGLF